MAMSTYLFWSRACSCYGQFELIEFLLIFLQGNHSIVSYDVMLFKVFHDVAMNYV